MSIAPAEWEREERVPLWTPDGVDILMRAGTRSWLSDFHETNAVRLTSEEENQLQSSRSGVNHHFLRAGHPRILGAFWKDFFDRIESIYRFSGEDDWCEQEMGFANLFQGFFGSRAVRAQFGWVSLITAQRPQHLRSMEDARIRVTTPNILVERSLERDEPLKLAGAYEHSASDFLFHRGDRKHRTDLRRSRLHRVFDAPELLGRTHNLVESRYVPSVDGDEDHAILKRGRIPSLGAAYYANGFSFGRTGYLNLSIVALGKYQQCKLMNNTLEIDPETGRIVSIRFFESPIALGLIGASVVEHFALCKCLKHLLNGTRF